MRVKKKYRGSKPHLVYYDGSWKLFRNRWKSQFRGRHSVGPYAHECLQAACICEPTIPAIIHRYEVRGGI